MDKSRFLFKKGDTMPSQKQDRRPQKTQEALFSALIALLNEKTYEEISVNDLIDRANVGRSTFYSYFQTKDDLLRSGFERALKLVVQNIEIGGEPLELHMDMTEFFLHVRTHYELYRTLVWDSGINLLIKDGHAALSAMLVDFLSAKYTEKLEEEMPLTVMCYSLAGSLLILLKWWLEQKMPCPAEQMNATFQKLVMPGIRNVLNLE